MDAILERITQNVVTTLNGLRIENGYSADIEFLRPLRTGRAPEDNTGVVFITDVAEDSSQPISVVKDWIVRYEIELYLFYSDYDSTPVDQQKANLFADINNLLMADAQRNQLAIDTFVRSLENFFDADGGFEGVTITFDVIFRTKTDNAFSL